MKKKTNSSLKASRRLLLVRVCFQLAYEIHPYLSELSKLKSTPTDDELRQQLEETKATVRPKILSSGHNLTFLQVERTLEYLAPLRAGTSSLLTDEEIAQLDSEWTRWRAEWVKRRKIFNKYVLPNKNENWMRAILGEPADDLSVLLVCRKVSGFSFQILSHHLRLMNLPRT